jgi:hypothetical protein
LFKQIFSDKSNKQEIINFLNIIVDFQAIEIDIHLIQMIFEFSGKGLLIRSVVKRPRRSAV